MITEAFLRQQKAFKKAHITRAFLKQQKLIKKAHSSKAYLKQPKKIACKRYLCDLTAGQTSIGTYHFDNRASKYP